MAKYGVKLERSTPLVLPRHPDAPSDDDFRNWCAAERAAGRPLAVDLFSGAGGLGYGVEAAGWTVVAAVDHDERSLETHRANFRGQALQVDMADRAEVDRLIDMLLPLGIDLVVGGPPCQPFSRAGLAKIRSLVTAGGRDPVDARRQLWRSFVDVVTALQPRGMIMENVPDMAIGDDLKIIREIADLLEAVDYAVDYRLLDAWRYGVPQHRKRFILQARKDGWLPRWPVAQDRVSVRDAIEDLPRLGDTTGARVLDHERQPTHQMAVELRDSSPVVYDHMTRPVRDDDREAFKLMTSKTLYSDLPAHLRRYRSDTFNDKYKRLDWDDLSRTITAHIAKDGYWYIHPEEHRTLTVREAARIQTFPDAFRFAGTRSDAFRQIGNAVPPRLGRAVAESIRPSLPGEEVSAIPATRLLLDRWAQEARTERWWGFPGPDMSPELCFLVAFLEVDRMTLKTAAALLDPLRGLNSFSPTALAGIEDDALTASRQRSLQRLRDALRTQPSKGVDDLTPLLSPTQLKLYRLLQGNPELVVSARVSQVVRLLVALPEGHQGLHTDIKVALAQLVATGPRAAFRMCALRMISVAEAQARIRAAHGHDLHAASHATMHAEPVCAQ